MKGCIISAPMTGSGKTTVTLGLLAALKNRGIAVQPFKVGPDFIDPALHEIASGVPSHNLDGWMLTRETNEWLFERAAENTQEAIVEGVMGLFDGFDGKSERGSTAEMAKWLGLPVILVIDACAMARSAAALIRGFQSFDPDVKIAGVIFNRVGGEGHYRILNDAVQDAPILGWLPVNPSIEIPERHLGLFTAKEELAASRIREIGSFFEKHMDLDRILSVGDVDHRPRRSAKPEDAKRERDSAKPEEKAAPTAGKKRVALAHDKAFSFYYHANRIALEEAGADIVEFSPLSDREVPEADILYVGGGYPELYRDELEANVSMRNSVREFIEAGKRFYAECGGLMYLAKSIDGAQMAGIVPTKIEMTSRLVDFGYCEITTQHKSILGPAGTTARGHQFHYSRSVGQPGDAYRIAQGDRRYAEGFLFPNGIASYIHIHFLSNPAIARNMLHS
jgi:cobyrinic acid a,c-diamide synthase